MLRNASDLEDYAIGAIDGHIGKVVDFYFDDKAWVIRHFIVDTGTWLSSRKVLISPFAVGQPNRADRLLPVNVTRQQVKDSPDIDTDKPVSRQLEERQLRHYGYPNYWGGNNLWGAGALPGAMLGIGVAGPIANDLPRPDKRSAAEADMATERREQADHRLRSYRAVMGYDLHAIDGDIGHVSAMLVEDGSWAIRYFVIETGSWWAGHQVLIAPQWIREIDWAARRVSISPTRDCIKSAPAYSAERPLDRTQEVDIFEHYALDGYWHRNNESVRSPAPH